MALQPARGDWNYRTLTSVSTATFTAGSLVAFNPRRQLVEWTSVSSAPVGISMHASVDSLANPGKCVVAVPAGGATMWVPTGTLALSALSLGQACGIAKSGNTVDQLDTVVTSVFSIVGMIYSGPYDTAALTNGSGVTRVEVAWANNQGVWFSGSTNTFAT